MDSGQIFAIVFSYLILAGSLGVMLAMCMVDINLMPNTDLNKATVAFFWPIVITLIIVRYFILMVLNLFKVIFKILTIKDKKDN